MVSTASAVGAMGWAGRNASEATWWIAAPTPGCPSALTFPDTASAVPTDSWAMAAIAPGKPAGNLLVNAVRRFRGRQAAAPVPGRQIQVREVPIDVIRNFEDVL